MQMRRWHGDCKGVGERAAPKHRRQEDRGSVREWDLEIGGEAAAQPDPTPQETQEAGGRRRKRRRCGRGAGASADDWRRRLEVWGMAMNGCGMKRAWLMEAT